MFRRSALAILVVAFVCSVDVVFAAAHFRVGRGGLFNQAMRDMTNGIRFNGSTRDHLMGTEQMTEIFIDHYDFYHQGDQSTGPIRRYNIADAAGCDPKFTYFDYWIMTQEAQEIPLLAYVYHPAMAVHTSRSLVSGGEDSAHDIGEIFYWQAALEYLVFGGMIELGYDNVPIDILAYADPSIPLPDMDEDGKSYQLGWARCYDDSEHDQAPNSNPNCDGVGKHTAANSTERTFGDPEKEKFLRMLAATRSYRIWDFLAFGDVRKPGTFSFGGSPPIYTPFDYNHYNERPRPLMVACDGSYCLDDLCIEPCSDGDCSFNGGAFAGDRIIHASWKVHPKPLFQKPQVLYAIANIYDQAVSLNYNVNISTEYGATTGYACAITLNPNSATYADWPGTSLGTVVSSRTFSNLSVPSHNVLLIRIAPTNLCP
ncbi:hypothetical protein K8I61_09360 [bacterium]|nr:hypothetical protein [bacterium]